MIAEITVLTPISHQTVTSVSLNKYCDRSPVNPHKIAALVAKMIPRVGFLVTRSLLSIK